MENNTVSRLFDLSLKSELEEGNLQGLVAAVATEQGILYEGASGKRDVDSNLAMTIDTACYIASMIKPFIAAAAMQLVERGKLELDSPVTKVIPELGDVQVLEGFAENGRPILRALKHEITLRHLLTHTSGLSYDFWSDDITRYMAHHKLSTAPDVLLHEPGERWTYGTGMTWVGKMIERVSGQSLEDFMSENLFSPLGISSISMNSSRSLNHPVAKVYQRDLNGNLKRVDPDIESRLGLDRSAWYGTAGDFLKFLEMLMHGGKVGGKRILRPDTVESMFKNQIGMIDVPELKAIKSAYTNDVNFYPGMKQEWGYGFLINTECTPEGRSAGSVGWVGIANTFFWIDLKKKIAGVFMAQILPLFDCGAMQAYRHFERTVNSSL